MLSRFSQTRSPRTALDAQLLVDKGGLKNLGLSQSQRIEREIGINAHQLQLRIHQPVIRKARQRLRFRVLGLSRECSQLRRNHRQKGNGSKNLFHAEVFRRGTLLTTKSKARTPAVSAKALSLLTRIAPPSRILSAKENGITERSPCLVRDQLRFPRSCGRCKSKTGPTCSKRLSLRTMNVRDAQGHANEI